MDFSLTQEQEEILQTIRNFVEREVLPRARENDEKAKFPRDLFQKLGKLGFFGLRYPENYGGMGVNLVTFCLCCEELARGDLSLAASAAMQSLMGTDFIYRFGTEEHKKNLLLPAIQGEKIGTIAFTEPGAGSDLASMQTEVQREGDFYVINGRKMWITSGSLADFVTVAATFDKKKGLEGIDFFLVETGREGLSIGRPIEKLGLRASETTEIILENCRVPLANRLSRKEGEGVANMQTILNDIRTMTGALSLGIAKAALHASTVYSKERVQFGRPISKFQAISFKIAEMATELEAARWLVYRAASLIDQKKPATKEAAMCKLFASEAANRIADEAMRIFASYGFAMEYDVQRYFRDSRFLLVGGGTSEILKIIIGKELVE
jgi:butyryl-CoA dehydrogenase